MYEYVVGMAENNHPNEMAKDPDAAERMRRGKILNAYQEGRPQPYAYNISKWVRRYIDTTAYIDALILCYQQLPISEPYRNETCNHVQPRLLPRTSSLDQIWLFLIQSHALRDA